MSIVFDPHTPLADESARACSVASRASGESLAGVTPPGPQAWLLVEDEGPWGRTAASRDERLPRHVLDALEERNIRLQLIRRPDRRGHRASGSAATVVFAWSDRERSWAEVTSLASPWTALDPGTLDRVARGERPGSGDEPVAPLVLVCTHGGVDPCCARFGRPVVTSLADAYGPMVWETTHVGGCRFAANVLLLPDGVMYGHTEPALAIRQVGHHLAGRLLDDPGLRGQAGVPNPTQAAELAVRRHLGAWDLHAVATTAHTIDGDDHLVTVAVDDRHFDVTVTPRALAERPYGCGDPERWTPEEWHVAGWTERTSPATEEAPS